MIQAAPSNSTHSPNAVLMLGRRRRRWPIIKTALGHIYGPVLLYRI